MPVLLANPQRQVFSHQGSSAGQSRAMYVVKDNKFYFIGKKTKMVRDAQSGRWSRELINTTDTSGEEQN